MFRERRGQGLTVLAIHLTRIAICIAWRVLLFAPSGGRTAKPAIEGARKGFGRAKTHRQGNVQNPCARLGRKPHGGDLDTSATQIIANGFAHPGGEQSMKVERGKVRDVSQRVEAHRLFEMLVDIGKHPMHPAFVF